MRRFLISNPNLTDNRAAGITFIGDASIVNTGPEGALVVDDQQHVICLSPRQPLPVGEQSSVEGVVLDGTFIVEVNGSLVPYSLTPDQLVQLYQPGNGFGIVIVKSQDGLFGVRNAVKAETEVRIIRTSLNGTFTDGSGVFKSLDTLGVEFGAILTTAPIEISCDGALSQTELYLEGSWDVEIDGEIVATSVTKDEVFNIINPFQ